MVALPACEEPVPSAHAEPLVWVLHDGKAGMASQSLGLAEATGFRFVEKPLEVRAPWQWLPPQLWLAPLSAVAECGRRLGPPWPDLVIGCGRNTAAPALAIRRASGGRAIAAQVQDPGIGRRNFDFMVVPEHDGLREPHVVVSKGALHRVTPEKLTAAAARFPALAALPRPLVGVLIGGSNRAYRLTLDRLAEIGDRVAAAVRAAGGSVALTPSRRTGAAGLALLQQRLKGVPAAIWDMTGENPYYAYLASADAFLVTADSVSMVSEAAATGKPVHVIDLPGGDRKFARFHRTMRQAGITRPFAGRLESWRYNPLDDTARAGAALRALVLDRRSGRGG
ncbi:MAG: mitochondrial fission ELM1 family protein [Alphaproteobacteria bacterium]|nr:mitochondrial fission ELM1 family protein [Alphaproteobacteria bacterium]